MKMLSTTRIGPWAADGVVSRASGHRSQRRGPRWDLRGGKLRVVGVSALLLPMLGMLGVSPGAAAPAEDARLGTAGDFAVLAYTTITNSGVSTIDGDVGLHPGTAVTGFESCTGPADCVVLTGSQHLADGVAATAKADLLTAYDTLVGMEATCTSVPVELGGGNTLSPGVYCSPTMGITGSLTLDGEGEYVFLTGSGGSTLITEVGSQVLLTNGADACDVYWQVASSATINAGSAFAGKVLAEDTITLGAGATVNGSVLAQNGEVTLINNTITSSGCEADASEGGLPTADVPSVGSPTSDVPVAGPPTADVPSVGSPTADVPVAGPPTALPGEARYTG